MTNQTIRGEFRYKDKNYPFILENRILTLVGAAFCFREDFQEEEYLGTLMGVTDSNQYVFLLDCHILNFAFLTLSGRIQMGLHGYILQDSSDDQFDCVEFYSPALRAFYSPRKAWSPEIDDTDNTIDMKGITLNPYETVIQEIPVTVSGEAFCCELGFARYFNLHPEDRYALSIQTGLILDFQTQKSSDDLGKYYLYVRDFLAFINFKRDIPFDDIVLWRRDAEGKRHKSGKAIIFQVNDIEYQPKADSSITFDDLGKESFAKLFREIAEQRLSGEYNPYFLPRGKSKTRTVEKSRWLMAAISFEGEFNKKYGSLKADRDEQFYHAKEKLLLTIDEAVKESGCSINDKKNKYFQRFRHLIDCYDTTIEEKFHFCEEHFQSEIEQLKSKYCRFNQVSVQTDFAVKYAESRNRSAHGVVEAIRPEDVVTFQMLRCFIYLLVMERASVPSEKRKEIIKKLF